MKRKGLLALPQYKLPRDQIKSVYSTGCRHVMLAEIKSETLILTIFDSKRLGRGAEYVIFIKQDDYISLRLVDKEYKWRTGTLTSMMEFGYYNNNFGEYPNGREVKCHLATYEDRIKEFLKADEDTDAVQAIINFQNKIVDERLRVKHRKITDKIDLQMEIVPELPSDLDKWLDDVPFANSRYIYYKRKNKKVLEGFCTYCKHDFELDSARHNERGICPHCNSNITYKATGKAMRLLDTAMFSIIQTTTEGIVVRYFSATRDFWHERHRDPKTHYWEKVRDFYPIGTRTPKRYEYTMFKQTNTRWCDNEGVFSVSEAILYSYNIKQVLENTIWKYSQIDLMAIRGKYFKVGDFLFEYPNKPKVEYLIKAGFCNLANDTIDQWEGNPSEYKTVDYAAKKMKDVLRVGMELIPQMQRLDVTEDQFTLIRDAWEKGIKLTDDQVIWAEENLSCTRDLKKVFEYMTVHKAIKYVESQIINLKTRDAVQARKNTFNDWIDYLRMCKQLKYDTSNTFVLFPKNLKEAHDEADELLDFDLYGKKHQEKIVAMYEVLMDKYTLSDNKYLIKAPKNANEIVAESHKLRHCVKQYIKNVAAGETIILFIRKIDEPENPFFTLEIRGSNIMQCRGYKNSDVTPEVNKFVEQFKNSKLMAKGKKKSA